MTKNILGIALLATATSSCVLIDADVTPYSQHEPKLDPTAVEILTTGVPGRQFEEIGLIEVTGNYHATYGKLVTRARKEAAALGADAIVVSRRPITTELALVDSDFFGPGSAGVVGFEQEDPRIWVVAIRWE